MKLPRYELTAEEYMVVFEFTSEGPKGSIVKLIKLRDRKYKSQNSFIPNGYY